MNYQYLSTDEMMALESHACDNYPITLEQMMQNAGRAVFDVMINEIIPHLSEGEIGQSRLQDYRVLVVVGKGNNGGDALVTARLLKEEGIDVDILSPYSDEVHRRRDWPISPSEYSLIIDALFGFSLKGNPRPPADKIIEQINCSRIPVLSVDVPSGLDVHDGSIGQPAVKADYTVVNGMPKIGFEEHPDLVGKVYLGDLGIPEQAYQDMKYEPPKFGGKSYMSVN